MRNDSGIEKKARWGFMTYFTVFIGILIFGVAIHEFLKLPAGFSIDFGRCTYVDQSVSVHLTDDNQDVAGAEVRLYKIGEYDNATNDYRLKDGFAQYRMRTAYLDGIVQYLRYDDFPTYSVQTSDTKGDVHFESVSQGLYVAVCYGMVGDDCKYYPDYELFCVENKPIELELSPDANGLWFVSSNDEFVVVCDFAMNETFDVPFVLLCDGEFYDAAILNADNNFTYSFKNLDASHYWSAVPDYLTTDDSNVTVGIMNNYNTTYFSFADYGYDNTVLMQPRSDLQEAVGKGTSFNNFYHIKASGESDITPVGVFVGILSLLPFVFTVLWLAGAGYSLVILFRAFRKMDKNISDDSDEAARRERLEQDLASGRRHEVRLDSLPHDSDKSDKSDKHDGSDYGLL